MIRLMHRRGRQRGKRMERGEAAGSKAKDCLLCVMM